MKKINQMIYQGQRASTEEQSAVLCAFTPPRRPQCPPAGGYSPGPGRGQPPGTGWMGGRELSSHPHRWTCISRANPSLQAQIRRRPVGHHPEATEKAWTPGKGREVLISLQSISSQEYSSATSTAMEVIHERTSYFSWATESPAEQSGRLLRVLCVRGRLGFNMTEPTCEACAKSSAGHRSRHLPYLGLVHHCLLLPCSLSQAPEAPEMMSFFLYFRFNTTANHKVQV